MAIEINCPHCGQKYKLRDEYAGKKVGCKNPNCKKSFVVPKTAKQVAPGSTALSSSSTETPPNGTPAPDANGHTTSNVPDVPLDAEALALSALADEPPPKEEARPEGKPIKMTCGACDHQWEVPRSMEGKNVLCPECKHRMRVPLQKEEKPKDWRQAGRDKPSMAKNTETLEGAWDTQAKVVTGKTLEDAGAVLEEVEEIPITERLRKWFLLTAAAVGVVFAFLYIRRERGEINSRNYMEEALSEFEKPAGEGIKRPLWHAALQLSEAEHVIRAGIDDDAKRTKAFKTLQAARNKISQLSPSAERNRLLIAIAVRMADLGGDKEAVKDETKVSWRDVQSAMRQTLSPLAGAGADYETKLEAVRELTRALAPKGKVDLVKSIVSDIFNAGSAYDLAEIEATIGIELLQLGDEPGAQEMAKQALAQPTTKSVQALVMGLDIKLPPARALPIVGAINDEARVGYAMGHALRKEPDNARQIAERPGSAAARFRALVQAADLLSKEQAKPLTDAAAKLALGDLKPAGNAANAVSPTLLVRLVRMLARGGNIEQATFVADTIKDKSSENWAKLEILRARIEANPSARAEEVWLEQLGDPKDLAAALGHQEVAKHNKRISDPAVERVVEGWSEGLLRPFGRAGLALSSTGAGEGK